MGRKACGYAKTLGSRRDSRRYAPGPLRQSSSPQSQRVKTTDLILPTRCCLALFSWSGVSGRETLRPRVYKYGSINPFSLTLSRVYSAKPVTS